jgi:hypothetical protein
LFQEQVGAPMDNYEGKEAKKSNKQDALGCLQPYHRG